MKGSIFTYDGYNSIFLRNEIDSKKTIVYIHGLGDNILSSPYINKLNELCIFHKISLLIPQLRSMPNFKITPIEHDVEDINNVVGKLDGDIILMGHSTGCNDILLYLEKYQDSKIKGVILQAPVSDPESQNYKLVEENCKLIEQSSSHELYIELPHIGLWMKERYISLFKKNGKEDLFSSYLEDRMFSRWLNKIKILSILSGNDEYAITDMKDKFSLMGEVYVIEGANHSVSDEKHQSVLLREINGFLKSNFLN